MKASHLKHVPAGEQERLIRQHATAAATELFALEQAEKAGNEIDKARKAELEKSVEGFDADLEKLAK